MARLLSDKVLKGITRSMAPVNSMVSCKSIFQQTLAYSTGVTNDSELHEDLKPSETSSAVFSTRIGVDFDTHDDFQPTTKMSTISIENILQKDLKENPVMIYMKGLPDAPRCGFSALAVKVLQQYGVPIRARDILADLKLKEAVKAYSKWPTFPQVFINGELVGGSDIVLTMHQKGELKELLKGITQDGN